MQIFHVVDDIYNILQHQILHSIVTMEIFQTMRLETHAHDNHIFLAEIQYGVLVDLVLLLEEGQPLLDLGH